MGRSKKKCMVTSKPLRKIVDVSQITYNDWVAEVPVREPPSPHLLQRITFDHTLSLISENAKEMSLSTRDLSAGLAKRSDNYTINAFFQRVHLIAKSQTDTVFFVLIDDHYSNVEQIAVHGEMYVNCKVVFNSLLDYPAQKFVNVRMCPLITGIIWFRHQYLAITTETNNIAIHEFLNPNMECPVCFQEGYSQYIRRATYAFVCQHGICKTCAAAVDSCPICRSPFRDKLKDKEYEEFQIQVWRRKPNDKI